MGVAVAVDDGLLVPVVRDVDQLSISGLNRAIAEVADRARAGKLKLDDYGGSTFTIDNTGWFGSNLTMPIINVPEVAILTMEAITKRPVVRETPEGDVIAIRPIMNMVLAIDHRANDGAGGGRVPAGDQVLARGRRAGDAGLLSRSADTRSEDATREPSGSSSPAGRVHRAWRSSAVSSNAATRSWPSSAIPISAAALARPRRQTARRATSVSDAAIVDAMRGIRRGRSTSPGRTGSGSRRPSAPRCTRPTSASRDGSSMRAIDGRDPARSSTSRPSTSSATRTGRIVDERYRRDLTRGLPELLRRDEVPRASGRRGADRRTGRR